MLDKTHPHILKYWNNKNKFGPENYTYGSHKKVWWRCKKGHDFILSVRSFVKRESCPYCSGAKLHYERSVANCKKVLKYWDHNKNKELPEEIAAKSGKIRHFICEKGHKWTIAVYLVFNSKGCPYCLGKRVCKDNCIATTHPDHAKFLSMKNDFVATEIQKGSDKIAIWECDKGHEWSERVYNKTKKSYLCPYCERKRPSSEYNLSIFTQIYNEWDYNKNLEDPSLFLPTSEQKVWWKCKKGHEWKASICSRVSGCGCPYCSGRRPTKTNNLLNKHPEIAKDWNKKNKYGPDRYSPRSNKKVWWKCKNNHITEKTIDSYVLNGCSDCNGRKSNVANKWLKKHGIIQTEHMIKIKGRKYFVDGFKNDIIYEFLGVFWHGDPRFFNPKEINVKKDITFLDLLVDTINRLNSLCVRNPIIYRWEKSKIDKIYVPIYKGKQDILRVAHNIYENNLNLDILQELK